MMLTATIELFWLAFAIFAAREFVPLWLQPVTSADDARGRGWSIFCAGVCLLGMLAPLLWSQHT